MAEVARRADLPVHVTALGTVTPLATVTVHTRVDGQLIAVHFREGKLVERDAPLAEIDPKPLEAQKAQAEAQLARDQALVDNAKTDLERFRTLWSQDSVAKEQVDTQEALVRQYTQQVKLDQALVDGVSLQLGYTHITAPIAGRTGLRLIDAGNMMHASDSGGLTVITQLQPISVLFALPQDVVPEVLRRFQLGEAQPVTAYARDGLTALGQGKVVTIDNQIDPTTGMVKIRAEFPNADGALFPNQFVNVELLLREVKDATLVPSSAVQQGPSGTFAYVVGADQKVSIRPLTLGAAEHDVVTVERGLEPGERVVTDGVDKLREGVAVELIDRNANLTKSTDIPKSGPGEAPKNQRASRNPSASGERTTSGKRASSTP